MAQEKLNVFFDLDGTLLDVSERNYQVYSELVKTFGGIALDKATYWDLKRKKTKWPALLPLSKLSPNIQQEFLDSFIPKIEDPKYLKLDTLFPDARTTLETVSAQHECRLISLRRNEANLLAQLDRLSIRSYFSEVLSGHSESDGFDRKIELIKGRLDDRKGVIIGDTEADIVTGQQLGLTTIAVTSGIRDEQFLRALEPDYLVEHVGDVCALPMFSENSSVEGLYL
jgi:phosphoglycolate phosphatase